MWQLENFRIVSPPKWLATSAAGPGQPPDYFVEFREGAVIDEIRQDRELCDRIYNELRGR